MSHGSPGAALRRGEVRLRSLRAVVRDTQRALSDVADVLAPGAAQLDPTVSSSVYEVGVRASRPLVLLVLGRDCSSRARLANCLLGERVLPTTRVARRWRWICLQYGSSRQVKLNLSNTEFELVEELECHRKPWTVVPEKDLERRDPTDLSTIMDIELNNPFLKDGLKIIIPPDLDADPHNLDSFRRTHEDFYSKRMSILKQYAPICFYALNCTGRRIFKEHSCDITRRISKESSRSEEDFWKTQNMYYMTRVPGIIDGVKCDRSEIDGDGVRCSDVEVRVKNYGDASKSDFSVFSEENCLDLQQVKELHPYLQIYFVLFSDSTQIEPNQSTAPVQPIDQSEVSVRPTDQSQCSDRIAENAESSFNLEVEATESTEQVLYKSGELPESERVVKDGDFILRPDKGEVVQSETDASKLFAEQCAFMYELMDQWRLMCCGITKGNSQHHWMILDEAEASRTTEHKPLPSFMSKAFLNVADIETDSSGAREKARELEGERSRLVSKRIALMGRVTKYALEAIHNYLLELCTKMSEIHVKLLQQFILTSFDMAREMQVVPKKIDYVAVHEHQLYETINTRFSEGEKKEELVLIMQQVLQDMKGDINTMDWCVDDLPCHQENRVSNSVFYGSRTPPEPETNQLLSMNIPEQPVSEVEQAISYDSYNFDEYDIVTQEETASLSSSVFQNTESLNYANCQSMSVSEVASNDSMQISLIRVENESSINSSVFAKIMDFRPSGVKCTSNVQISIKQASLDVQKTVLMRLSRKISLRLIKFVDCLRDSYFGTLQRCLESLEASCREELGGRPATEAMRQVLSVARRVDLQSCASFSVLRTLVEHLRRLFQRLRVGGGGPGSGACCVLSPTWRRDVALHTLHALSPTRLARLISAQILEKLAVAHEQYQAALAALAAALETRLHQTEDVKLAIRKRYAPGFARLCLESTSMCDVLQHGSPELGREIGRGQYGVVYACRTGWAGHEPCAVKSVLPSDERHYNELAMEFFYTRSIPPHPRIVRLWGSAVERHASGSPTVLLVMERKRRDLYCAVRTSELSFSKRCRISLDIVEGIRYLHSLGLVHRDIKMKNVLLDEEDRASLTDLGFCMPEALMSGSIVGTPVHMAPELLTGDYDSSVDVYAFGILFWYVCAGNIKLPSAFELYQNKEQLWRKVRRGLRPERLPHFTDDCWRLMESCWASEPSQRALLGDVQAELERILERSTDETPARAGSRESLWCSDDGSLNFSRFDVV